THGNDISTSSPPSTTAALNDSLADLHPSTPLPVLIRATDGRSGEDRKDRIKISTVVAPEDLERFYIRYAEVCKSGMQGLKKRDKSKRKKAKAKKRKVGGDGEKKTLPAKQQLIVATFLPNSLKHHHLTFPLYVAMSFSKTISMASTSSTCSDDEAHDLLAESKKMTEEARFDWHEWFDNAHDRMKGLPIRHELERVDKLEKENIDLKIRVRCMHEGMLQLKKELAAKDAAGGRNTKSEEEAMGTRRRHGSRSTAGDSRSPAGNSIYDRSASRAHGRSDSRDTDMTRNTQMSDDEREKYEIRIGELRDQISEVKLRNLDYGDEIKRLSREVKRHQEEKQSLRTDFDRAAQQCNDWMDLHERNTQGFQAMQIERDEALRQTEVSRTNFQDLKMKAEQATQGWKDLVDQLAQKLKQQEAELRSEKEETHRLRAASTRHYSSSAADNLERSSTNPFGRELPQKLKQPEADLRSEKEGIHRLRAALTRHHSSTADNLERSSTNPLGRELSQKLKQQEAELRSEKEETHRLRAASTRHDSSAAAENLETSQAVVHTQPIEPSEQRWIHRLRELERRLKAEREARLLDRSGARKRLEEGRAENEELRKRLELERVKREVFGR
ncbi:MAG: hypothetical protein Q9187_007125, partial [Circinaria calcarea]